MVNVLVVEDESIVATSIAERLALLGHQVTAIVDSGMAAIQEASAQPTDLVLMDIVLSGEISGIEAANHIQTSLKIPIVYITAYADETTLQRAISTQPFGYILKPFRMQAFDATVETAIARAQTEAAKRRELETLRDLWQQTELLNEARNRYVTMTSQEFRIPLTVIQASSDFLQRSGDRCSLEQRYESLQRIQAAVRVLNQLLELLMLPQETLDHFSFAATEVDLVLFCRELLEALAIALEVELTITFDQRAEGQTVFARIDERLLRNILINLLINAMKYAIPSRSIDFSLTIDNEDAIFQIQNRARDPLTDPNSALLATYSFAEAQTLSGVTLGLDLAKRCVDLHQGTIAFSCEASDCVFNVRLPLRSEVF